MKKCEYRQSLVFISFILEKDPQKIKNALIEISLDVKKIYIKKIETVVERVKTLIF